MCSLVCFLTEDSKAEFNKLLNSRNYYVAVDGSIAFSSSNDVLNLVLGNMA